jgi:nucleotide-binding universal stress UspA family protein
MQRLLVATDFSTRSDRAIRRATLLARKLAASLTLVHVVDGEQPGVLIEADRSAASRLLDETVSTMRSDDGIEADWTVSVDDVHSGIIAAADEMDADLVILGPHRARLRDVFVGTTAQRVVQRASRPLLIAIDTPAAHYERTLLALDFDEASKSAARKALAMGIFDQTDVVVMHAFDAPAAGMMRQAFEQAATVDSYISEERDSAAKKLGALVTELGLPPTCRTLVSMQGSPVGAILDAAKEVDSELIVMGTNQPTGLERALVGSVAADLIGDAHRDILIVPAEPDA